MCVGILHTRYQDVLRVPSVIDIDIYWIGQVRLFLTEDSPSQVGLGAQDHLQAKTSWLLHSTGAGSDDHLPPGFEGGAQSANQLKKELSQIPLVKWQCPPRFFLNPHWQVVAGQESKEVETQNQREMRVLEAVYPRPSAIPPSPSIPLESENPYDDRQTPLIPVTPIEDEDAPDSSFNSVVAPINNPFLSQLPVPPQSLLAPGILQTSQCNVSVSPNIPTNEKSGVGLVPGVEPDVVAAASAAFTAIMRSNEQGSLIDHELLIKILSSPKLIEKLVTDYGTTPANANPQTTAPKPPMNLSAPQSGPLPVHINRIAPETSASTLPMNGHFYPVTNAVTTLLHPRPPPPPPPPGGIVQMSTTPTVKAPPPVKDINYYKSLIQQHGGERPENEDPTPPQFSNHQQHLGANQEQPLQSSKQRGEPKPKIMKPCIYFNSSRGCKHGANCAFQHDSSFQQRMGSIPESQSTKRMKLDREITGRT
ncbi:zinc finger protein [Macleaya cordata]|uniref:Zinc finger protein n=1 Tax=Macleaya cordata TaxID=56857 RepID=A0A200QQ86_MACCD|nr:zinc finger protein [Macleaya cordata]